MSTGRRGTQRLSALSVSSAHDTEANVIPPPPAATVAPLKQDISVKTSPACEEEKERLLNEIAELREQEDTLR